jgi:hypothetical protein
VAIVLTRVNGDIFPDSVEKVVSCLTFAYASDLYNLPLLYEISRPGPHQRLRFNYRCKFNGRHLQVRCLLPCSFVFVVPCSLLLGVFTILICLPPWSRTFAAEVELPACGW